MTLLEIINTIDGTKKIPFDNHKSPKKKEVNDSFILESEKDKATKKYKATKEYEMEVFKYFYDEKNKLDIDKIYHLENACIDGLLLLRSGETISLEIKLNLNWFKCCNARIEFLRFIKEGKCKELGFDNPKINLIIFKVFSGDWKNTGWRNFYDEQKTFDNDYKVHIIQLHDNNFSTLKGLLN